MSASRILAASAGRRMGGWALLSGTTAVSEAMLEVFASAAFSPSFAGLAASRLYVRRAFQGSSGAMALFVALSGWYLASRYLENREREIALWLLAGMRKRRAFAVLAAELSTSIAAGLACGLAAGIALSRLFALILGALMRTGETPTLRHGAGSILCVVAACLLQLSLALGRAGIAISRTSIATLLSSARLADDPGPDRLARSAFGAILVGAGYSAAIFSRGMAAERLIIPALASTVIGTVLVFDDLVPALAAALRRGSGRLRAAGSYAAAQIAFRSRRNARLLALEAVLVGMAAAATGTVIAVARTIRPTGAGSQEALFGALIFIGGILSATFWLSALLLLVCRASADARADLERRLALRGLGASRSALLRALVLQNAFMAGLPWAFGLAHCAAALAMLHTFSGASIAVPAFAANAISTAVSVAFVAIASYSQLSATLDAEPLPR